MLNLNFFMVFNQDNLTSFLKMSLLVEMYLLDLESYITFQGTKLLVSHNNSNFRLQNINITLRFIFYKNFCEKYSKIRHVRYENLTFHCYISQKNLF